MSSFIVSEKTINRIVTWIDNNSKDDITGNQVKSALMRNNIDLEIISLDTDYEKMFNILANAFLYLNKLAVDYRYSEKNLMSAMRYQTEHATDEQVLKSMQCLKYQCSEGNVPEHKVYKMLTELIQILTNKILYKLPEYESAEWG